MSKILREKRANLAEQSKEILERAEKEGRALTSEETVQFDKIHTEINELGAQVERSERQATLDKELAASAGSKTVERSATPVDAENPEAKYSKTFRKYLIGGIGALNAEERAEFRGAQTTQTGNTGGYTIPEEMAKTVEESMKAFGGMREVASVIKTSGGYDLRLPTSDDTSNVGEILAENTAGNEQTIAFGQLVLEAWKYSSKVVLVPTELLEDTAINIVEFIGRKLGERIARIQNTHFTTGDGSGKPQGLVYAAAAGETTASASAITMDEIINWVHSVDPAYRRNGKFMLNDATVKYVRKLKNTTTNEYAWQPSLQAGVPDSLLGFPVLINQDVASIAATAKVGVFGDLSKYIIRDVADFRLKRLDERFADADQVGFMAFLRSDGDLLDAGTDPVKALAMHA